MAQAELLTDEDLNGHLVYLKFIIPKLAEYKQVLTNEVNLVVQYLLSAPETLVCLYGIMPDEDSLPHFFPTLSVFLQEPQDADDYVHIYEKLKTWHLVYVNNCKFMYQLFDSMEANLSKEPVSAETFKEGLDNIHAIFE